MPIDSVSTGKARRPAGVEAFAQAPELRALPRHIVGRLGDAHDSAQPQPGQRRDRLRERTASPAPTPLFDASPLMLTCTQTSSGGSPRAAPPRAVPQSRAGRSVSPRRSARPQRALLPCNGPIRCHSMPARSAVASIFAVAFLHVVLAELALARAHAPRAPPRAGNVLLTASTHDRAGSRPAAARRPRDARRQRLPRLLVLAHNRSNRHGQAFLATPIAGFVMRLALPTPASQRSGTVKRRNSRDYRWTSPSSSLSRSRTRRPTCICRPDCRR